jgi:hypothetical protein
MQMFNLQNFGQILFQFNTRSLHQNLCTSNCSSYQSSIISTVYEHFISVLRTAHHIKVAAGEKIKTYTYMEKQFLTTYIMLRLHNQDFIHCKGSDFLLTTVSRLAWWPTQPTVLCVLVPLSPTERQPRIDLIFHPQSTINNV